MSTRSLLTLVLLLFYCNVFAWGFFAHERINRLAVFCLPPAMMKLYKTNIDFITRHATDPDKRRYAVAAEAPRHYLDIDVLDRPPYQHIPRDWKAALAQYSYDSLQRTGILPWYLEKMMAMLTKAFRERDQYSILRKSAEIGHYIADGHVPLHACSNHNGQLTQQQGIHGLWESRIPELLADKTFDYWAGTATYIPRLQPYFWQVITESGMAADTVLTLEKRLSASTDPSRRYSYEDRNGKLIRNYAAGYARAYNEQLNGMVERRMKQAIHAVASCWYTAWVNAGQPSLDSLTHTNLTTIELTEFSNLQLQWQQGQMQGRSE
ncbi:zinc dependent phospholipase C family protein [Chitinophaga sp. Hz27]|uniref:zinc dependent phospholipase C family protein n=1 Tax=Chitinophaga sp. Hz27 TaxID=3347169 RepID=UPI0035E308AB